MRILTMTALVAAMMCLGGCPLSGSSSGSTSFKSLVYQQFEPGRVNSESAQPVEINGHAYPDSTTEDTHAYDPLLKQQQ